jgi:2',3'-cyclic-nucleotide 2'-phosphodiesterase (5'-nucleotidase family)
LNEYRKNNGNDLVVVDDGDLLGEDNEIPENVMESAQLKADAVAEIYNHFGIDAVNVGEKDLALGVPYLKELEKKWNFPFVSANLVDESGAPIFKKYVIKEVAGVKVGIFGIINDSAEMADLIKTASKGTVKIADPLEAASAVMAELSGKVDYVVALAHEKTTYDWRLARRVDGIDLIVGGHDATKTETPKKAGNTLMVGSGEKGQYQGLLEVTLGPEKSATNQLIPYTEDMAADPAVKKMITDYNDKIVALYSGSKETAAETSAPVELRDSNCQTCHPDQYQKWQTTDHAKAFATLVDKSKQFDPSCLVCHTTRFEQPGGFTMKEQQADLRDVQCESCHGNATDHLATVQPIPTPKPPVSTCVKCHTRDRCPDFEENYDAYWQKIAH